MTFYQITINELKYKEINVKLNLTELDKHLEGN